MTKVNIIKDTFGALKVGEIFLDPESNIVYVKTERNDQNSFTNAVEINGEGKAADFGDTICVTRCREATFTF